MKPLDRLGQWKTSIIESISEIPCIPLSEHAEDTITLLHKNSMNMRSELGPIIVD